jgi:Flp pilus assembly protein TadD
MRRFSLVLAWVCLAVFLPGVLAAQNVKSNVDKGIANCEAGHFDQAMNDFNAALKQKPNDASLLDYRGMVYRCKGKNDLALQDFNRAIQLDPKFSRAYRNRAMLYYDLTDYNKSLADLNKAKSLGYKIDEDFVKMVARKAAEKK